MSKNATAIVLELLDAADRAIGIVGPDGAFVYANPAARRDLTASPRGRGRSRPRAKLAAAVAEVRAEGRSRSRVVLEIGSSRTRWRGGLWPVGADSVGFILATETRKRALTLADALALSVPEARLARDIASGRSNHEIAAAIGVSVGAVKARVSRLYRKLGVSNRVELTTVVEATLRAADPEQNPSRA